MSATPVRSCVVSHHTWDHGCHCLLMLQHSTHRSSPHPSAPGAGKKHPLPLFPNLRCLHGPSFPREAPGAGTMGQDASALHHSLFRNLCHGWTRSSEAVLRNPVLKSLQDQAGSMYLLYIQPSLKFCLGLRNVSS